MRRLVWVAFILIGASMRAWAQEECDHDSEDRFDALAKALSRAKSCGAAVAKWRQCSFGSSADTQLTPIVIAKCEKTFLDELSPAAKKRYADEMQLCAYRYARQEGTMWMAIAAGCQVDVAAHSAAYPAAAGQPAARASFDCDKAQTVLEKAICSDIRLGHADIVLSRVYTQTLKSRKEDRPALVQSEKQWMQSVPAKCGVSAVPLSEKSLNCVRNEFELRFTALDSCTDNITDCLQSPVDEDDTEFAAASVSNPRASFDCEAPSTPLETVICGDARVGQMDIKLAQAYHDADKAMAGQHKDLVDSERQWLGFVDGTCPLGAVGGIPDLLARACVREALETRIAQLQGCPQKGPQERIPCLNDFQLLERQPDFHDPGVKQTCQQLKDVLLPEKDQPGPKERKALAQCNSMDLYFGLSGPADPIQARKCAYTEVQRGYYESSTGGPATLMMIYANGSGVERNLDLAIHLACKITGPSEEIEGRVQHLAKLKEEHWAGNNFDACDDITSGYMQGFCAWMWEKISFRERRATLRGVLAGWSRKDRQAFAVMRQAANEFFLAHLENEIDWGGTGRTSAVMMTTTSLEKSFVASIQRFERGELPKFSAADFASADAELNAAYQRIQEKKHPAWGDPSVTKASIKKTERVWVRYRDAWIAFGQQKYPTVDADSWKTWLTRDRTKMLQHLLD